MRQCVKSIFGVLKWSVSPKNFDILLCVQTWWCHGVLKPLRISMNWMWNSVLDKTDKMSNFGIPLKNRKKGSIVGQSHLEMHILCSLSFFVCSKKNMSNAICVQLFENHPDESPSDCTGARQRFWPRASYGGPIPWGPGPGIPNRFTSASTWTITGWWFGTFFHILRIIIPTD